MADRVTERLQDIEHIIREMHKRLNELDTKAETANRAASALTDRMNRIEANVVDKVGRPGELERAADRAVQAINAALDSHKPRPGEHAVTPSRRRRRI